MTATLRSAGVATVVIAVITLGPSAARPRPEASAARQEAAAVTALPPLQTLLDPGGPILRDRNGDGTIDLVDASIVLPDAPSPAEVAAAANVAARLGFESAEMNLPMRSGGRVTITVGAGALTRAGVPAALPGLAGSPPGEGLVQMAGSPARPVLALAGSDDEGTRAAGEFVAGRFPFAWDVKGVTLAQILTDTGAYLEARAAAGARLSLASVRVRAGADAIERVTVTVAYDAPAPRWAGITALRAARGVSPAGSPETPALDYPGVRTIRFLCTAPGMSDTAVDLARRTPPPAARSAGVRRREGLARPVVALRQRGPARRQRQQSHPGPHGGAAGGRRAGSRAGDRSRRAHRPRVHRRRAAAGGFRRRDREARRRAHAGPHRHDASARRPARGEEDVRTSRAEARRGRAADRAEGLRREECRRRDRSRPGRPATGDPPGGRAAAAHLAARQGPADARRCRGRGAPVLRRPLAGGPGRHRPLQDRSVAGQGAAGRRPEADRRLGGSGSPGPEARRPRLQPRPAGAPGPARLGRHRGSARVRRLARNGRRAARRRRLRDPVGSGRVPVDRPRTHRRRDQEAPGGVHRSAAERVAGGSCRARAGREGRVAGGGRRSLLHRDRAVRVQAGLQLALRRGPARAGRQAGGSGAHPLRGGRAAARMDAAGDAHADALAAGAVPHRRGARPRSQDRPRGHRLREGAAGVADLPGRGHREGWRGDLRRHIHACDRGAPGSDRFPDYEKVRVSTGWITATVGGARAVDRRIVTDPERVWDIFQSQTLPRMYDAVMVVADGKPRPEDAPHFGELTVDVSLSEPEYSLGIDQERISPLESLHEDVYFGTLHFFDVLGKMGRGQPLDYPGHVVPVMRPLGKPGPGRAVITFKGFSTPRPMVSVLYVRADGRSERVKLDVPKAAVERPSAVAALVRDGADGLDRLDLRLRVDTEKDERDALVRRARAERVDEQILSAEQVAGTIAALGRLRAAGLYRVALAYPGLGDLRVLAYWTLDPTPASLLTAVLPANGGPAPLPDIAAHAPAQAPGDGPMVPWTSALDPAQTLALLARMARFKEAIVYRAGESYMGREIWAMDLTSPVTSSHGLQAKATTLKPTALFTARQHANEVSSTTHVLRLAELLLTDEAWRKTLDKVNVVIHPITNPDGAQVTADLARITPEYMLHAGYLGSLGVDVTAAQWETDAIYPESKVRAQLWRTWLPDLYLNPHGYPSHEWVQLFSEYAGWVRNRVTESRDWWGMRGWFMPGFAHIDDPKYPRHKDAAMKIRAAITQVINGVPEVKALNARAYDRYTRYGFDFDAENFKVDFTDGVLIYSALKGGKPNPRGTDPMSRQPNVTIWSGTTEAPDEPASGAWMSLVADAGLAWDKAMVRYLAEGRHEIERKRDAFWGGVSLTLNRPRPPKDKPDPPAK